MTIVIEYVILDNMSFNYLILYLTVRTLKCKVKHKRILLSAFVGTLLAIAFSLIEIDALPSLILKLCVAPLICFVAAGYANIKTFFRYNLFFLAYTFVLGGVIIAFFYLTDTTVTALSAINYSTQIPVGVFIAGLIAALLVGAYCIDYIKQKKQYSDKVIEVDIFLDKVYTVNALIDTGNSLAFDDLPVCFIVNKSLKKKLAPYFAVCTLNREIKQIQVNTVLGQGSKNAVLASVSARGKIYRVLLSTADAESNHYELLLHNSFFEEG